MKIYKYVPASLQLWKLWSPFLMTSDVIAVTLVVRCSQPFGSLSSNKAIVVTLAIGYVAGWENLHTVAQPQYSPQVTTVIFSTTVPQKSTLPKHATPRGEEETQMSMCNCDLVVCSTVTVHHDCLFSSRSTLSLHSSSTLCFRWEFLLPLLSALYAIVNGKKMNWRFS